MDREEESHILRKIKGKDKRELYGERGRFRHINVTDICMFVCMYLSMDIFIHVSLNAYVDIFRRGKREGENDLSFSPHFDTLYLFFGKS